MLGKLINDETQAQIAQAVRAASLAKAAESLAIAQSNLVENDPELARDMRNTVSKLHGEVQSII